ncbi:MAG TPA: WecB/TagA/CpsF family glycosyltransferase [Candidatus Dormibacteraeota bacterium]|nr:WecB/TagA/CpsF family glycosyltransferase [Candidatus Dormibacteraeota bacterium]
MSAQKVFKKYKIFGVEVDAVNMAEAIDHLTHIAHRPKSKPCYVVKPYVEFLDLAKRSKEVRLLLNNAEMCLPDGVSVQWAGRYIFGIKPKNWRRFVISAASIMFKPKSIAKPFPEKFGGVNFTWPLLRACRDQNLKVFLIGSPRHNDISQTARIIRRALPDIKIVGTMAGKIDGLQGKELLQALRKEKISKSFIERIEKAEPDMIFVGMGFPLQEYVMAYLAAHLKHGVLVGEGGSFDYESFGGKYRRTPSFFQKVGLEWLWRLTLEPSRYKRQLAIPRFMKDIYNSYR